MKAEVLAKVAQFLWVVAATMLITSILSQLEEQRKQISSLDGMVKFLMMERGVRETSKGK